MDPSRLKKLSLFSDLSKKALEELGRITDEVDIPEGRHLAEQGDLAYEFFIIEDGKAEVLRNGEVITTLGPGDFFGEIGLMGSDRRSATVVPVSSMRLIVMFWRDFRALEERLPEAAAQIRRRMEERLERDRTR